MKIKEAIKISIIIFIIISLKSTCYAKYVFDYIEKAAQIEIISDDKDQI